MNTTLIRLKKRGTQTVAMLVEKPFYDTAFIKALGRAYYWQSLIDTGKANSGNDIARQEKLHPTTVNKLLRLTLLCPDIIQMLMEGRQPKTLTLAYFKRNPFPVEWEEQLRMIG